MNIIDKTPPALRCAIGACPALYATDNDTYLIVGKRSNLDGLPPEVHAKVGADEVLVEIPKALIEGIKP